MTEVLKTPEYPNKKLFGRKWKVSVLVPKSENINSLDLKLYTSHVLSDSDKEEKSLRVTFKIQKFGWTIPNFSEITVYNLNPETTGLIVKAGQRLIVEAGYVNGDFSEIYDAPIFQPLWEKEDNVTSKLTFRCVDALGLLYENHVEMTAAADYQKDMILRMLKKANTPFTAQISDKLENKKLFRPKVFFDNPMYYLRKYSQQSGTLPSVIDQEVILERPQEKNTSILQEKALVVSPEKGGLIGTPTQTQDGIEFTMLLNPQIKIFNPPVLVKINPKFIKQSEFQYGTPGPARLDEDYTYRVIGITHTGDTRGND